MLDHISGGSTVYDDLDMLVVKVGRLFGLHTSQVGCSFFDDMHFLQGLSTFSGCAVKNVCDLAGSDNALSIHFRKVGTYAQVVVNSRPFCLAA